MLRITISKQGEAPRTNSYDKREITVGRTPANDVQIPEPGVSSSHARILNMDGALTIIDLESTNGTFVNGQRIRGPHIIQPHDEVYICAHKLQFDLGASAPPPRPYTPPPNPNPPPHGANAGQPGWGAQPPSMPPPIGAVPAPMGSPLGPPAPIGPPLGSAPPPPVGPPMMGAGMGGPPPMAPPMPPPAPPPPMHGPPPSPIGAEPPRLAVPSPVGVGGPMRSSGHGEPPTLPPMIMDPLGTSDTRRPQGRPSMPLSVPPPASASPGSAPASYEPPPPIAMDAPPPIEAAPAPISSPPPPIASAPISAPPPVIDAPPAALSMPPPLEPAPETALPGQPRSLRPIEADAPHSLDGPPALDDEPPAVLEPIEDRPTPIPRLPPQKRESMPAVTADPPPPPAPPPAPTTGSRTIRPRAMQSSPPGTPEGVPENVPAPVPVPDAPDVVPVRSGATMFAGDVDLDALVPPKPEPPRPPAAKPGSDRPASSRRSGVIEAKPSGPTSPGLAPPPSASRSSANDGSSARDSQRLARPAPVSPLQHSAPISIITGLGRPEDLAGLDPDEQTREACARVFSVAVERAASSDAADLRDQVREDLNLFATHYRHIDVNAWTERIVAEIVGLGPLEAVLADPEVRDVFIHGPDRVLARRGQSARASIGASFSCPQAIEAIVRRLTNTMFGVDSPVIDARTFGGQEVYAVHDSVAAGGPVVNIRVLGAHDIAFSLEHLVATGVMTPGIANLLDACVRGGLNIAICAGPGAQAFPLLAALAEAAPPETRQLVVRPSHEPGLLPAGAVVLEGSGLVGTEGGSVMQALVRTAMGLQPDRLLVHDLAGSEVADVFAAMGRGLQGTVITLRASTTGAALARLGTLIGLAGGSADVSTRTLYAAQTLELMVAVSRFADGQTRVTQVSEACLSPTGAPMTVDLVTIDPQTRNWTHTGVVPTFAPELQRRGIRVDVFG